MDRDDDKARLAGGDLPANDLVAARAEVDPRSLTPARIGLGRTGVSVATRDVLEFARAHALARDAVHARLPLARMLGSLRERGFAAVAVESAARDRAEYLRRPDLARRLSEVSAERLRPAGGQADAGEGSRLAVVIADGLSALAAERHALPVLERLTELLGCAPGDESEGRDWRLVGVVVAEQARVALGDAVGEVLEADAVVVLIGERPGLSSPDSLGAYVTWRPRRDTSDAERNCVSNVRVGGLDYEAAAREIAWYCREGRQLNRTGVGLHGGDEDARELGDGGSR